MKQLRIILLAVVLAAAAFLVWTFVQQKESQQETTSKTSQYLLYTGECNIWDTLVSQRISGENAEAVIQEVTSLLQQMERSWSADRSDSVINQIAADAGIRATQLTEEEFALLEKGMEFSKESDGCFDITDGPLRHLWQEGEPTLDQIGSAVSLVDYTQAILDSENRTIWLPRPGAAISVDGLIWGYAAQQVLELYQQSEITGAEADLGVAQVIYGTQEDGSPCSAVITGKDKRVLGTVSGVDGAFLTCADPPLDPKSGTPFQTDLLSVTVMSEDPIKAQFLATLIMAQGSSALETWMAKTDLGLIIQDASGNITVSDKLAPYFARYEGEDSSVQY